MYATFWEFSGVVQWHVVSERIQYTRYLWFIPLTLAMPVLMLATLDNDVSWFVLFDLISSTSTLRNTSRGSLVLTLQAWALLLAEVSDYVRMFMTSCNRGNYCILHVHALHAGLSTWHNSLKVTDQIQEALKFVMVFCYPTQLDQEVKA